MSMIDDRGADYVARWPHTIARQAGISVEYIARALKDITGTDVGQMVFYEDGPVPEVGELTAEQAKAVAARMREIHAEIIRRRATHCRFCGLLLRDGTCDECGDPLD